MKYLFLIFSLVPRILWSQYHINFETDSVINAKVCESYGAIQYPAGRWNCQGEWAISGIYSLHHSYDNPESGCDYFILTLDPLRSTDSLSVSFRVKHAYNPSSANNWQIGFLADYTNGLITEGLILGVNFMGSDDLLKLWKCTNGECIEICRTTLNYQEQIGVDTAPEIKMVWHQGGKLNIYFTRDPVGESAVQIGSCQLDILPRGRNLVVRYEYSSSQDRKLWIDDIFMEGHFVADTTAPFITGIKVLDELKMEVEFSESVTIPDRHSITLTGLSVGSMNPDRIIESQLGLMLSFPEIIPNREECQLKVTGICDMDANCLRDTLINCLRNEAEWGDVVFNELMADPIPMVLLPEEEYMEIYNRSAYKLDLTGWRIEVDNQNHLFDVASFRSEPDSYGLITGINLPNDGASLALYSSNGTLIHAARYKVPWNGIQWKTEGGWSLESPDPDQVCNISSFWEFSSNTKGGTPGAINSNDVELEDREPPVLLYAGFGNEFGYGNEFENGNEVEYGSGYENGYENDDTPGVICLHYSEPVRFAPWELDQFRVTPANLYADSVVVVMPLADQLQVWFPEKVHKRAAINVHTPAVSDCFQNLSRKPQLLMGKVSELRFGSVLINEIMYDPVEGAPEYIEFYFPDSDFYDLQDLSIDIVKDEDSPRSPVPLSGSSRIISQGDYLVASRNVSHLMEAYNLELSGRWLGVNGMDGMNNSGGIVYLTDRAGSVVDVAYYGDQLHMELINVTQGISLERISFDRPGTIAENWHSAASIEGYSTPGEKNSQSVNDLEYTGLVSVVPKVFSPDNDGYQDLLEISISPGTQGWVIGMWVTDLVGRRVKTLANNHLAGPSVTYTWNGNREDGKMAGEGIYVIHVTGYHPEREERWRKKEVFGLVYH